MDSNCTYELLTMSNAEVLATFAETPTAAAKIEII